MAYNPENAKEGKGIPQDTVLTDVITEIKDGTVKDFVKNTEKWSGSVDTPCLELSINIEHDGKEYNFDQVMTYQEEEGVTIYPPKSNMGKYNKKYGKLPQKGDELKCVSDSNGFLKIKIE